MNIKQYNSEYSIFTESIMKDVIIEISSQVNRLNKLAMNIFVSFLLKIR